MRTHQVRRWPIPMLVAAGLLMPVLLSGCAPASGPAENPSGPPTSTPSGPGGAQAVAPGLHDQPDGTVVAVGTLAHSDLEGGFWAIYRPAEAGGAATETIAVIANGAALESTLAPLAGRLVSAKGTRLSGASIRMAGPEINVTEISGYAKGVQ